MMSLLLSVTLQVSKILLGNYNQSIVKNTTHLIAQNENKFLIIFLRYL